MDEGKSGGGLLVLGSVIILTLLVFQVPFVETVVYRWIPGAVNAFAQVEIEQDIELARVEPSEQQNAPEEQSAPEQITISDAQLAQVQSALQDPRSDALRTQPQVSPVVSVWRIVSAISTFISLLLVTWVVYIAIRSMQLKRSQAAAQKLPTGSGTQEGVITRTQRRWEKVVEQANSENESEWRLAIIEADIMLNELLDAQGYRGDTMSDKMKQVERSDFNTIEYAWEAHKVRNRVAHDGSDHALNAREVKRIIKLYESVFREFHFI